MLCSLVGISITLAYLPNLHLTVQKTAIESIKSETMLWLESSDEKVQEAIRGTEYEANEYKASLTELLDSCRNNQSCDDANISATSNIFFVTKCAHASFKSIGDIISWGKQKLINESFTPDCNGFSKVVATTSGTMLLVSEISAGYKEVCVESADSLREILINETNEMVNNPQTATFEKLQDRYLHFLNASFGQLRQRYAKLKEVKMEEASRSISNQRACLKNKNEKPYIP